MNAVTRDGHISPILQADFRGHKFVAVGSTVYGGSWKTFIDFLQDFIDSELTREWGNAEIKKPLEDRHPIMKWYDGLCRFQKKHGGEKGKVYQAVPNGDAAAYFCSAYDLYVLKHHGLLHPKIISRLKHPDQFQGVRYEIAVAATCLRAGFTIKYEDETDGSTNHSEFVATHIATKESITVEAKSRHRPGVLGFAGDPKPADKLDIQRLLTAAVKKASSYPHVIFLDANLPPLAVPISAEHPRIKELMGVLDRAKWAGDGIPDPFNLIVLTNHPFHYGHPDQPALFDGWISILSQKAMIPTKHPETLMSLVEAVGKYGQVPNFFSPADEIAM